MRFAVGIKMNLELLLQTCNQMVNPDTVLVDTILMNFNAS